MENNLIRNIFLEYSQSEEYTEAYNDKLESYFDKAHKHLAKDSDSEDLLVALSAKNEEFGFVQGFKYAMRLSKECGVI